MSLALFFALAAAANGEVADDIYVTPALPTQSEVITYVSDHWQDWGPRFANLQSRRGESVELVSVRNVSCGYYTVIPECSVEVTARFPDGTIKSLKMETHFERDQSGRLVEVFVFYESGSR